MRLKVAPGDFRVRESLDFVEDRDGPFFVHRLRKEKLDTLQAIKLVAERARVDRSRIAFAGLKDRQGVTEQWISIEGARVDWRGAGIDVRFVGRSLDPITSKLSHGNDFAIVVRDLGTDDLRAFDKRLPEIENDGFANYFDDQRFACLRHDQGFVMKEVLRGRFERALKSLIAVPSKRAITGDVRLKRLLSQAWGDWGRCKSIARGPVWQRLFEHLIQEPDDFRGALALLPPRQKLIHAFAYQSYLWNRGIDLLLKRAVEARRRTSVWTIAGTWATWRTLSPEERDRLRAIDTPLYGPGGDGGDPQFASAMERVLRDADLEPSAFEAPPIPGMALREEPRALVCVPRRLRTSGHERDERHRGRRKIELRFGLPRGSYATMLVKHLFESHERPSGRDREAREDEDE